jgi:RNA polymerase sigma-70 factor, ECF subfamily
MYDPSEHSSGFIVQHGHESQTHGATQSTLGWDWEALRLAALSEARTVLRDDRAQDAAQEATLRAWRHARTCRTPERPVPWVRAIARREALRLLTRDRPAEEVGPGADGIDDPQDDVQRRVDVAKALAGLDGAERMALAARYWLDLTDRQLASHLGIPVGTAKVRLHRTRAKLRLALSDQAASRSGSA